LLRYLENRKTGKPDDWAAQIARFLAGELDEPGFFKAAKTRTKTRKPEQLCEGWFYAGAKRLIDGDKAEAAEYFEKSVGTGEKDYYEYQSAAAGAEVVEGGEMTFFMN